MNEDSELITSINPQDIKNPTTDSELISQTDKRRQEINKKQKLFKVLFIIFGSFAAILIIGAIASAVITRINNKAPSKFTVEQNNTEEEKQPDTPIPNQETNDVTTWTLYSNPKVRVFIRHPLDAKEIETSQPALKVDVIYDKTNPNPINTAESSLGEGYIFRVTPLPNVEIRDLASMTNVKMESFRVKCPKQAYFSIVKDASIDEQASKSFEILNCDGDYIVSYTKRFGIYFEIVQFYKGDFGYKQKYRAALEDMLRIFKFYPEKVEIIGPTKTFRDEQTRITIVHPNLDETCCKLPAPPIGGMGNLLMLGDKATYKNETTFDGIGFFVQNYGFQSGKLAELVENQRKLLREDYKVVVGSDPTTQDLKIKVGEYDAYLLRGYSWQNNDFIYAEIPSQNNRTSLLVVSVKNISGESFSRVVDEILASFKVE